MHKRTEITIETERFLVVSRRRRPAFLMCHTCDKYVPMLTVAEAARTIGSTPLVISGLAEAGKLHFAITAEGQLFICSDSLAAGKQSNALE